MTTREIMALCAQLPAVTSDSVFGPGSVCYRVGGRIFAMVCPQGIPGALCILRADARIPREEAPPLVTLRCTPDFGDFYKRQYPNTVYRPYHSPPAQQPHGVTVLVDGSLPDGEWPQMIGQAWSTVLGKLPKKVQREITAGIPANAAKNNAE